MVEYDDEWTLRGARRRYFDANGFGDGGYTDRWVKLQAGPLPIVFPNSSQRLRSVRLHDLHHVVTGYGTDWTGEAEIGAWEIGSNCRDHVAAWLLNLLAMGIGVVLAPEATWRAFVRGRCSRNLYEQDFREEMLDETVGEMRRRLALALPPRHAIPSDGVLFVAAAVSGWISLAVALAVLVAPLVLLACLLFR